MIVLGVLFILLVLLIYVGLFYIGNFGHYAKVKKERGEYKLVNVDNIALLISLLFIIASILLRVGAITLC